MTTTGDGYEPRRGATLVSYFGDEEVVELPEELETVGEGAFKGNESVRLVVVGPSVTRIEPEAFMGCISLENVVVRCGIGSIDRHDYTEWFDYHQLVSIGARAFKGCSALVSVEFEGQERLDGNTWFDYFCVGDEAFAGCASLETLDLYCVDGWLSVGSRAFAGCTALSVVELSDALGSLGDDVFEGCTALECVSMPERLRDSSGRGEGSCWTPDELRLRRRSLAYRDVAAWWEDRSAAALFKGFSSLERVDLRGLDTSDARDLRQLFFGCRSLKAVDLSCLDTSQVTTMAHLLHNCRSLERVNLLGLDLSQVKSLWSAFDGCSSLTSLDLSGLSTPALTHVGYLFRGCSRLEFVDISGLDLSQVKSLSHLLCDCKSLCEARLAGLDLRAVTTLTSAFEGCDSLVSLDLSSLRGARVQEMDCCFKGCSSLAELDLTGVEVDARAMHGGTRSWFEGCSSLTSLKLPKVLGANGLTRLSHLFDGCNALESWRTPPSWPVDRPGAIPTPTAPCDMWWSERDRTWMTVEQIRERGPMTDTYTNSANA